MRDIRTDTSVGVTNEKLSLKQGLIQSARRLKVLYTSIMVGNRVRKEIRGMIMGLFFAGRYY